jgi:hypothetical protein
LVICGKLIFLFPPLIPTVPQVQGEHSWRLIAMDIGNESGKARERVRYAKEVGLVEEVMTEGREEKERVSYIMGDHLQMLDTGGNV